MIESISVVARGRGQVGVLTAQEHEGTSWSDENGLHLDCSDGYMTIYGGQFSLNENEK